MGNRIIKFSIITSVRNCLEETKEFLSSLHRFSKSLNYELILIDDGSEDETRDFLKSIPNARLVRNHESRGFAFSNNLGASRASGDWLMFLNNDLVLKKSWFVPFIECISILEKSRSKLGCLGNIQIDPRTGKIDHAGIKFKEGFPSHHLLGETKPNKEKFSEYLAVTGACFLIKKQLFLSCGGFDEDYKTGFEDIDLCLRLRMLGYRHYVANQSVIAHKRSSTPERNEHQEHNSRVFYGRWGKLITRFQEWERVSDTIEYGNKITSGKEYITEKPENFLFADQKLLEDFFGRFLASKKFQEAEDLFNIYEANHFGDKQTFLLKSKLLRSKGDLKKAKSVIDLAIKNGFGKEPSIMMEGARIHQECGNFSTARRKYHSLLGRSYQKQNCILNVGDCYFAENKFREAEEFFTKAILLYPDSFRGWSKLAESRKKLKKTVQEIEALNQAHALSPNSKKVRYNLFNSYLKAGSNWRAYKLLETFDLRKVSGELLLKIARLCLDIGDINKAVWCLQKLVEREEKLPEVHFLFGNAMVFQKHFKAAVKAYRTAIEFRNDWPEAISNLINSKTFLCDWKERDEEILKLINYVTKNKVASGAFELAGLYQSEKEIFEQTKTKNLRLTDKVQPIAEKLRFTYKQSDSAKKRLGFLSSDFRNHAVGHLIIGLLDNLDRKKYEIFLYSTSISDGSEISKLIEQATDEYHDLSRYSLIKKAQKINHDSLDLLIDLGGLSKGHNAELLALKPAPRQAHYLGYASTMGKGFVEWIIADKYVIPPSSTKNFGEKIIRMDGCFMPPGKFKNFNKPNKRTEVGLPGTGFVYCAFHAVYKIEPKIWACWMRILKAVPESVLWLKFKPAKEAYEILKTEAVRLGVSSKRIIMADDLAEHNAHLSRMAVADLYLDAPLYNGHASAMDALKAKLPILTLKGDRYCNRVGESLCRNIGLSEMIARDLKDYENKAIELGLNPAKLISSRKKIQENKNAVLSPISHSRRFELAIEQILAKPISAGKKSAKLESKLSPKPLSKSLEDFTLVMIRPKEITNWVDNVSMLADELKKYGGKTIVIDQEVAKKKASAFSNSVQVLYSLNESFTDSINHSLCEISTNYLCFLDDPLRVLPASHFVNTIQDASASLIRTKIGILGICSSVEPHAGCLVTKTEDSIDNGNQIAGFFSPSFVLNADAVRKIGGLRRFGDTAALPMLDLSLRFSQLNYKTTYIDSGKIICPAHSATENLSASSEFDKSRFVKLWKRHPVSLKPKFPPKDEQVGETADYQEWIRLCDTITDGDILAFKKEADELPLKPLISVIMPVFDPPKKFLIKAIESVILQAYENWELCIADDASTKKYIRPLLESYARKDARIKVTFRKTNGHISVASNSALKLSSGEFVAFLDHDDELRPHALLEVAKVINENPEAKFVYSDEGIIDASDKPLFSNFKPDWNPELLLGQNYICHLTVFDRRLLMQLKGLRKGFEGAQDWDLNLRFTELVQSKNIFHIPKILYFWRSIKGSTALNIFEKSDIFKVSLKTITETTKRRKINAKTQFVFNDLNYIRLKIVNKSNPKVSIIIPIKDRIDLLKSLINSILDTVSYTNYEIIIIDNDSIYKDTKKYLKKITQNNQIKVLKVVGEFNYSKINNLAVMKAKGDILLLLNNDVEAIELGWFEEMLSHALKPEIGCVGAKLLYTDKRLQHGGVIVGLGGAAGHSHRFTNEANRGYMGHLSLVRNSTAVTAACLMIRREVFLQAGGLDESNFKIAFNDVDFCLRVERLGYRNLWTPFAKLFHHESASRGDDFGNELKKARFFGEISRLQSRWDLKSYNDPNYNPNLTKSSEQYWYALKRNSDNIHGHKSYAQSPAESNVVSPKKNHNKKHITTLLKKEFSSCWNGKYFNCMPSNAHEVHNIFKTENISEHEYDGHALEIIKKIADNGFILDCGSGNRPTYYSNIVNFDPVAYDSTDVVGVGEDLPFKDDSFDAVFSLNVLEHVRDPFKCASEIKRVLKPGGKLYCVVPFMSPYHGYPDHYYNMTKSGLKNLFNELLYVQKQDVLDSGHPIHSITWILRSWVDGLADDTKIDFLETKVSQLIGDPNTYFDFPFVKDLTLDKKFELGATTAIWCTKKKY